LIANNELLEGVRALSGILRSWRCRHRRERNWSLSHRRLAKPLPVMTGGYAEIEALQAAAGPVSR
jgi:hypothetical protein